ncbi:MAG: hypothetical protein KAH48_01070 [Chlorobi bacterium]|nr:hypothetical protein [Chlorobiota bacterium]
MKINSSNNNVLLRILFVSCILGIVLIGGCYSFTGGTIPEHLKTLNIGSVNDRSGYGDPRYREMLEQLLVDNFQADGSFDIVERGGDAKLTTTIISIRDQMMTVRPGESETERKITVSCEIEYYDVVKKKVLKKKTYSNFDVYELTNPQQGRIDAISNALKQASDDILFDIISGW